MCVCVVVDYANMVDHADTVLAKSLVSDYEGTVSA